MIPRDGLAEGLLMHLDSEGEDYFDHFVNFHNHMNELRNESLASVNPLLHNYIKEHTTTIKDSREFFVARINELKGL